MATERVDSLGDELLDTLALLPTGPVSAEATVYKRPAVPTERVHVRWTRSERRARVANRFEEDRATRTPDAVDCWVDRLIVALAAL